MMRYYLVEVVERGKFEVHVKFVGTPELPPFWVQVPHNSFEVGDKLCVGVREHSRGLKFEYIRKEG